MKLNLLLLIFFGLIVFSCKEGFVTTSEMEVVDFVPHDSTNVLMAYPNGVISFSTNNSEKTLVDGAIARVTPKETLVVGKFYDPITKEETAGIILGAKGFSVGSFQGNIINIDDLSTLANEYNQANITFTNFGDIGELVSGNFSLVTEHNGEAIELAGEFDAIRAN